MRRIWAWLTRRGRDERLDDDVPSVAGVQERAAAAVEPDPTPAPAPPFPDPTPMPDPSPPTPQPSPPTPPQPDPAPEPSGPVSDEAVPDEEVGPDPRAEELRAKLAEAKAAGSDREEFEAGETPVDAVDAPVDIETRRKAVHEEARAALDQMRGGPGDSAA